METHLIRTQKLQAVILAAGRGSRLKPISLERSKAMTPVVGKPIVERVMEILLDNQIQDFILVISPDDQELKSFFAEQTHLNARIRLVEQAEPRGMGHALLQAAPYIRHDFVLSSCDNLVEPGELTATLDRWAVDPSLNAILTALPVEPAELTRMGVLRLDGDWVTEIVEKPSLEEAPSNIGSIPLYIFSKKIIEYLPEIEPSSRGEIELQDAMQKLIEQDGRVLACQLSGRMDLTTPQDLLRINLHYLAKLPGSVNLAASIEADSTLRGTVYIEREVTIGMQCTIGPNVFIERGCIISNYVHLENCVVLRERIVRSDTVAINKVIW